MVDEERVELAAGRVTVIHVQGLEVVPVGLDLGPFGDLETQPDEHVLESLPRLGHEVRVPPPRLARVLGQVETLRLDSRRERGVGELGPARLDRALDRPERLVHGLAGDALVVDRRQGPEPGLQLRQVATLTQQAGPEHRDRVEVASSRDLGEGGLARHGCRRSLAKVTRTM